jgi:uncharacterized protein (DUF2147 family)
MQKPLLFAATILLLATPILAQASAPAPAGRWRLEGAGGVEVVFQPCGSAFCGVLQTNPQIRTNPDATDEKNPDPKLRARKLRGVSTFIDLTPAGDGWKGRVYVPPTGATYAVTLRTKDATTLTATGCILPLLCQTSLLTAVP